MEHVDGLYVPTYLGVHKYILYSMGRGFISCAELFIRTTKPEREVICEGGIVHSLESSLIFVAKIEQILRIFGKFLFP